MKTSKFKMTELGPIPVDWEVKRLGDFCSKIGSGSTPTGGSAVYLSRGTSFIRSQNVYNGYFKRQGLAFISELAASSLDGVTVVEDDVLLNITGDSVARCTMVPTDVLPARVSQHVAIIRVARDRINPSYLQCYLTSPSMQTFMLNLAHGQGGSRNALTKGMVADFQIPLPPLAEQRRIAGALSDIDELISALGKLIEKKRNIKTGAMQELLGIRNEGEGMGIRNEELGMRNCGVPRRRLPGFSGEWVEKRLGDCGFCFNGITGKSGNDFGNGGARYITFLNILSNVVVDTSILDMVDIKPEENQNEVRCGDLFFNTSSETPEEVGFCAVLDEDVKSVYLNSFCFGFRLTDDNISGKFLAYWFRAAGGRALMTFLAQGSTRYNLSKDAFREASVCIPPTLAEQKAIAEVLSDMDAEIEALEAKRAKYESIKQGMMQELLTGKTRLV